MAVKNGGSLQLVVIFVILIFANMVSLTYSTCIDLLSLYWRLSEVAGFPYLEVYFETGQLLILPVVSTTHNLLFGQVHTLF